MNLEEFNAIKVLVEKQLWSEECLLNAHRAKKNKGSGYICVFNTKYQCFMSLRFSDHPPRTTLFANVSSIYIKQPERKLYFAIQRQLRLNEWYRFTYRDFFTIKMIMNLKQHKVDIALDVIVHHKQQQQQKLSFYQVVQRKNKQLQRPLDKELKTNLQQLFHTGMINYAENESRLQVIYITPLGWALFNQMKKAYYPLWRQDVVKLDWYHLRIPDIVERRDLENDHKLTQNWKYRMMKYYVSARVKIEETVKEWKKKYRALFKTTKPKSKKKKVKVKQNTQNHAPLTETKRQHQALNDHWEKQVSERTRIEVENLLGEDNLSKLEHLRKMLLNETPQE